MLIAIVFIVVYSFKSKAERAHELLYDGYKLYAGLYEDNKNSTENLKAALEKFKKAYDNDPSAQTLYYIANTQYRLGQYNEALRSLDELIKKHGDEKEILSLAYVKKATILLKQDKKQAALKVFDELYALKKSPYFKDVALYEAARILENMGQDDEAKKRLEKLVKEFPTSPYRTYAENKLKPKEKKKEETKSKQENQKKTSLQKKKSTPSKNSK